MSQLWDGAFLFQAENGLIVSKPKRLKQSLKKRRGGGGKMVVEIQTHFSLAVGHQVNK